MDAASMPIPLDPVSPPQPPKGRDAAPGKKREEKNEAGETIAAAAGLTVSFAEILQSKKLDLKTGGEERTKKEPVQKTVQTIRKEGTETMAQLQGQLVSVKKPARQTVAAVQEKETLEHAKDTAGLAMKAAPEKPLVKEGLDGLLSVESAKKGALTPPEEAVLKEMIQKNGSTAGPKKTTQMTGFVNGEPLNRPDGIRAVKSMAAKEGEVLKNLSGGDEAPAPSKTRPAARPAKPQQPFTQHDATEGEGNKSPFAPNAESFKQELTGRVENPQEKLAAAGNGKKQGFPGGTSFEARDANGAGTISSALGRGIDNPTPVRPQAVVSQVLEGATQILRNGSERMVMTLQPPRLGTLDLDVVVENNTVKMVMLADNQEVKQMLQAGMDDLRNALQERGFQVDRLEVLVQNRSDEAGSNFWQEAGFAGDGSPKRGERKQPPEAVQAAGAMPARSARAGDSGLSVFA